MSTKKKRGGNALSHSDNTFVHSNRLVEAHYKEALSHWEMFIFSKMCAMIDPADTDFKHYKIYIKDILDHLNVKKGGHSYKYVVEAAQRLLDRRITIYYVNDEGKKIAVDTHLVSSVHRLDEPDESDALYISLTFPPELKPSLLQLKDNFTILDLDIFKFLKTPTSVRLYQLLSSHLWKAEKKVQYDLEELKKKLGVADKYEQYGPFKTYVLHEAQTKLAENTNISFTYLEMKTGKKVTAIVFYLQDKNAIREKEVKQLPPPAKTPTPAQLETTDVHETLMTELFPIVVSQFGVGLKVFTNLVASNTEGDIREAVKVTEKAQKAGKIENLAGFFVKAVQEHYRDVPQIQPKEEQNAHQIAVKKRAQEQEQLELNKQKQLNEKRKQAFLEEEKHIQELITADTTLADEAIEHIQRTGLSTIYDKNKPLNENLQNPSIRAVFHLAVKKLRPEAF
jgi:plasmid replication initiation protein